MAENEILVSEQVLQVPFVYSAGPVASRFLLGLRDEEKLYGIKCGACSKVYVPPRATCPQCFGKMEEWVEVGPQGVLENFTVIHYVETVHPAVAPFALGIVRLTGADTGLLHLILAPLDRLKIGMRLKPMWAAKRTGQILDLAGFAPVAG